MTDKVKKPVHPLRLYKITAWKDGCVYRTELLGLYLVRMNLSDERLIQIAKLLGGDNFASGTLEEQMKYCTEWTYYEYIKA